MCTNPLLHHCLCKRKKERKNRKLLLNWAQLLFRLNTARFYRWLTPEVIFTEEFTDLLCHLSLRARWVSNETRWFGDALHHYGLIMMMSYRTHDWHHIAMVLTGQVKSLRGRKEAQMCPVFLLHLIKKWRIMVRYVLITRDDIENIWEIKMEEQNLHKSAKMYL